MSLRIPERSELDLKQRMTLFNGTGVSVEVVVSKPVEELTFEFFVGNGVRALNILTAGIRPLALQSFGVHTATQLRQLGFDALYLNDPIFAEEACAAYGSEDVVKTFLCTANDAVALSGSDAVTVLNVSLQQLLELCAGMPTEANAVLQQTRQPISLLGVKGATLLDTGLRAPQLTALGISAVQVRVLNYERVTDFAKFGF